MTGYWLGLATIPFVAGSGLALWGLLMTLNWILRRLVTRIMPKSRTNQASAGALIACTSKSWWLHLPGDAVLIFAVGFDSSRFAGVREAIAARLLPRPAPGVRFRRPEPQPDPPAHEGTKP